MEFNRLRSHWKKNILMKSSLSEKWFTVFLWRARFEKDNQSIRIFQKWWYSISDFESNLSQRPLSNSDQLSITTIILKHHIWLWPLNNNNNNLSTAATILRSQIGRCTRLKRRVRDRPNLFVLCIVGPRLCLCHKASFQYF